MLDISSDKCSSEILDRFRQPLFKEDAWRPVKFFLRQTDIRAALHRIIARERFENNLGFRSRERSNPLRQLQDCELYWIADIHRAIKFIRRAHQTNEAIDQVVHIAERPGLIAVTIYRNGFILERLDDEIGNHAAIIWVHTRAIGIEYPRNFDAQIVLTSVVEKEGFGAAFALVIARAYPNGIHVTPVILRLRMHLGVTIDFAGGCLKNLCLCAFGQPEHIDGPVHAGLGSLNWVVLVMNG